ncbi:MAG: AAA family ATPase [Polaromonas sp.]|nr:AAA family ATPase [Polaromonas sp.]
MYAKFFGLSQDPFSIAPDPRYLFMSERHREALAHLLYGLGGGGGFVLLSGEIGTGKTTVCRCFLEQIPDNCNVAYIFNPKLSVPELLRSICDEFHIDLPQGAASAKDFIDPLNAFLLRTHAAGQNNVLIIDEAQNLSADVLEQLRLLTNLETNERKLLQIVLIGQPELRSMLARPELEQLAQRVIARFHLDALSTQETTQYIAHRMAVAGMTGATPFDSKATARIHQLARGVPRRINLLAGRALLGAYASGTARIDRRMVDQAAGEVFGSDQHHKRNASGKADGIDAAARPRSYWPAVSLAVAGLAGLLVGAAVVDKMGWRLPSRPADAVTSAVAEPAARPASSTAPSPVLLSQTDLAGIFSSNWRTQNEAWQALGQLWGLALDDQDPCRAALQQRVYCFSSKQTALSLLRELNRPGIVTLFDGNSTPTYALLTGLTAQTATLRRGAQTHTVPLPVLAQIWRGDFATLWRAAEGYSEKATSGLPIPASDWLATQLAKVPGAAAPQTAASKATQGAKPSAEAALRAKIYAFQLAQGLTPDGQAGPLTVMQLNRATGMDEPRLQTKNTPPP